MRQYIDMVKLMERLAPDSKGLEDPAHPLHAEIMDNLQRYHAHNMVWTAAALTGDAEAAIKHTRLASDALAHANRLYREHSTEPYGQYDGFTRMRAAAKRLVHDKVSDQLS